VRFSVRHFGNDQAKIFTKLSLIANLFAMKVLLVLFLQEKYTHNPTHCYEGSFVISFSE